MKAFTKLALFVGLVSGATLANAAGINNTGYYAGAKMGISAEHLFDQKDVNGNGMSNDNKGVGNAGLVFGYNFENQFSLPVRAELDYTFRANATSGHTNDAAETNDSRLGLQTLMVNGYYDIKTGTPFTPYVGAGIGYANVSLKNDMNGDNVQSNSNNFAWSVGTGVIYNVNERLDLDLGYKYLDAGKASAGNSQAKVTTHDVTLGVNYYF
ncbi:porin family protein [Edwardsiella piscicida]|uniref:outer membrane protein n=1 Tax=Edwardsiella piscicida TaxID=1263550 RepID=UPI00290B879D|nr:porin family protein [Edwardsiella piscicida]